MKVLMVVTHPRKDSLTHAVAKVFSETVAKQGSSIDILDLHVENFDPRMTVSDEPDWENSNKNYSVEVQNEMDRLKQYDALVITFPIWWSGLPAMLKGWLDRVWNQGFAYGGSKLPHQKILWLALAGGKEQDFTEDGYDKALEMKLIQGASHYCGIQDANLEILYESLGDEEVRKKVLERAQDLAKIFA